MPLVCILCILSVKSYCVRKLIYLEFNSFFFFMSVYGGYTDANISHWRVGTRQKCD